MAETHCRHFSGYKPCGKNKDCNTTCPSRDIPDERILIIALEAMGSVLRATSILPALKRKYPKAHVTWLTKKPSHELLKHNPFIDRIVTLDAEGLLKIQALQWDQVYSLDKSLQVGGILKTIQYEELFGFRVDDRSGAILPATPHAKELWELGLNDEKKFFKNIKAETQLLIEALNLGPFQRDPYVLQLSEEEQTVARLRRRQWASDGQVIVGFNTGCSPTIPYKKLSVEVHRALIENLVRDKSIRVVLLGGPEDTERNFLIAQGLPSVLLSPTERGLRDGICSVEACDVVVSGDSLGMHMAIALNKWVVAWFGPTCIQEIDLYDYGKKVMTSAPCSPCWKRSCQKSPMCYDLVSQEELLAGVRQGIECITSSYKLHLPETSSSPSP